MRTRARNPRHAEARIGWITALLLGALACAEQGEPLPDALVGVWVTDAPEYSGRSFTIRRDSIVFGTRAVGGDPHALVGVERLAPVASWETYRRSFRELDGEIATLDLAHRVRETPELRMRNRSEVWRPAALDADADREGEDG